MTNPKLILWQLKKNQIKRKLKKNYLWRKKTPKLWQSSKILIVTKLKSSKSIKFNSKCLEEKTPKFKLWQKLYYDKTPKSKILIATKPKEINFGINSKTKIVTKLKNLILTIQLLKKKI